MSRIIKVFFLALLSTAFINAQQKQIDSVFNAVKVAKMDTVKLNILLDFQAKCQDVHAQEKCVNLIYSIANKLALSKVALVKRKAKIAIATNHNLVGTLFVNNGEFDSALVYFNKSCSISAEMKDLSRIASAKGNIGVVYYYKGDLVRAMSNYFESLKLYEALGQSHDNETIEVLNCIGAIYFNHGDIKNAIAYYEKSLKIAERANASTGIATALNNLAAIYKSKGDISTALEYFEKSVKLHENSGNKEALAASLINIGSTLEQQGNVRKALDYYGRSLAIMEGIGNKRGMVNSLIFLGSTYKNQGDLITGLDFYSKAFKIGEEIGDNALIARSCNNLGSIYQLKNDYLNALNFYNRALKISEQIGDKLETATTLNNLGIVCNKMDSFDRSQVCFKRSLTLFRELDDKRGIARNLNLIGVNFLQQKKIALAYRYCDSSLIIAKQLGFPIELQNAHEMLSKLDSARGNFKEAYEHYKHYVIYRDSLNNKETRKASVKNQLKYEYDKKSVADSVRTEGEKQVISAQLGEEKTKSYALYGGLGLVAIFAGFMVNRFRVTNKQKKIIELKENETQKQNLIISHQKHLVEEKHKEITDSINYAERIQRSFIATKELLDENLKNYFVLFKPKDVVSGDFYWAAKLNNGNFALVTADSTGHGVPGAIMSLLNVTSLEKAIEKEVDPSEVLNSTRKTIIERLKKDGSAEGGKDGMDASLCVYDFINKKLIVAAANNPVWIVRASTSSATNEVIEIKPDKMPIGKHDKQEVPFTQQVIDLHSGDIIYTLTDGFPDQFGGERGKKFMSKNLRELLVSNSNLSMSEQKALLESEFKKWVGDLEQVDDVTLIGVKV